MFTFDVDAASEVVLAPDRNGPIQAFLEVSRDHGLPRGRVAAEHDERDVRVEAEGGGWVIHVCRDAAKIAQATPSSSLFPDIRCYECRAVISNGDHRVP